MIGVRNRAGRIIQARAVLDGGSQSNFITNEFLNKLQLDTESSNVPVEGLGDQITNIAKAAMVEIHSNYESYSTKGEFLVLNRICGNLPNEYIDRKALQIPRNIHLADPGFHVSAAVDVLLGAEIVIDLMRVGKIHLIGHSAKVIKTALGWIVGGRIGTEPQTQKKRQCMITLDALDKTMSRFWDIQEYAERKFLSPEEQEVEEFFTRTTRRDQNGRYIVRLPFNGKISKLGESAESVKRQFLSLERKLSRNDKLRQEYILSMQEAIALGHMREYDARNLAPGKHCFLPHHAVVKETSTTTKLRIVYNASNKTSTGISLNECQMVGAVVQSSGFDILLRFRTHQVVIAADIEKMYKQVLLDELDVPFQLLFWREDPHDELKTYAIPVVLFGSASAAHCATRVIKQLTYDEQERHPLACAILRRDCYVDDVISGAEDTESAIALRNGLLAVTRAGGFTLRKWVSNDPAISEFPSQEDKDIKLFTSQEVETKALGLKWNREADTILYEVNDLVKPKITKRGILSTIARLYDPIGLLGPIIAHAKILMQRLWQAHSGWDEAVTPEIYTKWVEFRDQLHLLSGLSFLRKVIIREAKRIEIHGFCDASEKSYGACIYVRSVDNEGRILTNLLCSKGRVAPLKTVSLPKLELCSALVLARLVKTVQEAIHKPIDEFYLWSDSAITLQWIATEPHRLKTFVANRVAEIRNETSSMQWRHVASEDNSADALSRGQLPTEFIKNKLWQEGPLWLSQGPENWPNRTFPLVPITELRPITVLHSAKMENELLHKFSSLAKLRRIVAYCHRFIGNIRKNAVKRQGDLDAQELERAFRTITLLTQREVFAAELEAIKHKRPLAKQNRWIALNPFIDEDGIIRVGSRMRHSLLEYSEKYPMILPKEHHITKLIVQYYHERNFHSGAQTTLNAMRAKFWPIHGLQAVRSVIHKCVSCCKNSPKSYPYFMGDLPPDRVRAARPFLNVGVDYCGPFFIKEKKHRNRNKVKVWVAIFVCFSTKAVHMELVSELTTDAFLAALKRFFARRGNARHIYSDNGTNFVGAKHELDSLFALINSGEHNKSVRDFLAKEGITWHFSPARSPHFGGLWEAAVKSFKQHFYRTVGDDLFTYEDLQTYVIEIEGILNSRPLTPLSTDPQDLRPLTPFHFLIGDSPQALPEIDLSGQPANRLSHWEHITRTKQHFWRRWHKEYLNTLKLRSKWYEGTNNEIKIGDMVLLKEDNIPPRRWIVGRIIEVFPGGDNEVRVVNVYTTGGTYKRAITKLAPLPVDRD